MRQKAFYCLGGFGIQKLFHIPEYIHVLFLTAVSRYTFDGVKSVHNGFVKRKAGCTLVSASAYPAFAD